MPEIVVFWDIDGTILSTSMERLFIRHLLDHGHISKWQLPLKYASLIFSSRCKMHRLKLAYMRGMASKEADSLMDKCFEHDISPQLIPDCTSAIARIAFIARFMMTCSDAPSSVRVGVIRVESRGAA